MKRLMGILLAFGVALALGGCVEVDDDYYEEDDDIEEVMEMDEDDFENDGEDD